jgi:hypothetical protein
MVWSRRALRFSALGRFEADLGSKTPSSAFWRAPKFACYRLGMTDRYRLGGLSDRELLAGLAAVIQRGNEAMAELLLHLAEVDERALYAELGFSSLFAYCLEVHAFSETAAGRRITAARLARKFPEVLSLVASGDLHLSALSALAACLNQENASALFETCKRKSRRQVDELLAARFPKPDFREGIRRLPTPKVSESPAPENVFDAPPAIHADSAEIYSEKGLSLNALGSSATAESTPSAELTAFAAPTPPAKAALRPAEGRPTLEALSADRFGVRFTIDAEFRGMLERLQGLLSHRFPKGDMASALKFATAVTIRELEKERFAVGRKPRVRAEVASSPPPGGGAPKASPRSRHIPAASAREVYLRDGGQCTFVSADGRRCAARRSLEIDHVHAWAMGGSPTPDNLRLRCRTHNQWQAKRQFGRAQIESAVAQARRAR